MHLSCHDKVARRSTDERSCCRSPRRSSEEAARSISEPKVLEQYVSKADYAKEGRNEASLREGQVVQVIEKTQTGEFRFRRGGWGGWVEWGGGMVGCNGWVCARARSCRS